MLGNHRLQPVNLLGCERVDQVGPVAAHKGNRGGGVCIVCVFPLSEQGQRPPDRFQAGVVVVVVVAFVFVAV